MRIILEKSDIEGFIKSKYPTATIIDGLNDDIEIYISIPELKPVEVISRNIEENTSSHPQLNVPIMSKDGNRRLPRF
jgi:hypothetical protein